MQYFPYNIWSVSEIILPLQYNIYHIMAELKSTDYSRLVQFIAQKIHMTILNKTQMNKILFYVYGVYLAVKGEPLFNDDTPKAWVYGPVFPISNKRFVQGTIIKQSSFSDDEISAFKANNFALRLTIEAVKNMHDKSAIALTEWSHQEGSPWYETVYVKDNATGKVVSQNPWNTTISKESIIKYFINNKNRIFG